MPNYFPPTIVFQVNLSTDQALSQPIPNSDLVQSTRSTGFMGLELSNYQNMDGQQFTAYGQQALYLKNNFTKTVDPIFGFLDVISTS